MESNNKPNSTALKFRTHRPGDMGYITYRHAVIYDQDHALPAFFERDVSRIAADFLDTYDATLERCWVAEKDEKFLGSVALVKHKELRDTAMIRLLLVEREARGLGLGTQMVQKSIDFAREAGYKRIRLWTLTQLTSARRLYTNAGFEILRTEPQDAWGGMPKEEWELTL
ncbi:acyl-CoA N-acyltransferase [Dactylonectria estremocensis]|uniref:Acyl-CoA N-acyltransferase n=1 Tax=Dactylonectria estremocensis TaxID=1079267 RepID=A0A9P9ELH4_9HYPO|nr:acyl-CoA N-acyltransferase [Dactylonectria estremocensis]